MKKSHTSISDYRAIRFEDEGNIRQMVPEDILNLHYEARQYLESELQKPHAGKRIVVTHFSPAPSQEHRRHLGSDISPYFNASCEDLIRTYQPDAWIFGHTHWSCDTFIGGTRILSNQGGYPFENAEYTGFREKYVFQI